MTFPNYFALRPGQDMAGAASRPGEGGLGVVHLLLFLDSRGRYPVPLHQDVFLQGEPVSRGEAARPGGRRRAGRDGPRVTLRPTQARHWSVIGRPGNGVSFFISDRRPMTVAR